MMSCAQASSMREGGDVGGDVLALTLPERDTTDCARAERARCERERCGLTLAEEGSTEFEFELAIRSMNFAVQLSAERS